MSVGTMPGLFSRQSGIRGGMAILLQKTSLQPGHHDRKANTKIAAHRYQDIRWDVVD